MITTRSLLRAWGSLITAPVSSKGGRCEGVHILNLRSQAKRNAMFGGRRAMQCMVAALMRHAKSSSEPTASHRPPLLWKAMQLQSWLIQSVAQSQKKAKGWSDGIFHKSSLPHLFHFIASWFHCHKTPWKHPLLRGGGTATNRDKPFPNKIGRKVEHKLFSQTFRHLRDIPAKSRDIPQRKIGFPGFEGHTELFGPHPFTRKTPLLFLASKKNRPNRTAEPLELLYLPPP